jgi:hypothetical protein
MITQLRVPTVSALRIVAVFRSPLFFGLVRIVFTFSGVTSNLVELTTGRGVGECVYPMSFKSSAETHPGGKS